MHIAVNNDFVFVQKSLNFRFTVKNFASNFVIIQLLVEIPPIPESLNGKAVLAADLFLREEISIFQNCPPYAELTTPRKCGVRAV
jgi:hypothetical protein